MFVAIFASTKLSTFFRCRHGSSTNGLMLHGRRKLVKSNGKQSGYCGSTGNFRTGAGGRARGGGGWGGRGGGGGGGEVYLTAGVKEYQRRKEARAARDKSPILGSACRDILGVSDQRRASRLFEDISPATSPNFRKRLSIQAGSLSQLQGQVAGQGRRLTCFWDNKLQGVFTGVSLGKEEFEEEKQEETDIVEEKNGEERRKEENHQEEEEEEEEGSPPRRGCRPWVCAMDMFTLLKNSMGADDVNPILKHFSLGKQTGSAGVEMTWKIYEAVRLEDKKVSASCLKVV